jgi:hypothetical protein
LPETPDETTTGSLEAEVQPEPMQEAEVQSEPQPKVQNDPLVTTLSEIMDQYVQKQRTIQEWTQDLDRALRRQSLARGFDPTADRHDLVRQLGDALDHEMLVAQLTDMLDIRSSSYSANDEVDLGVEPDRYPEHDEYATKPLFEGAPPESTPKQYDWEPPAKFDPAKRQPHPDPMIDSQQKEHTNHLWSIRNAFRDHLANRNDIPDPHKQDIMNNVHAAIEPLPAAAAKRLNAGLSRIRVYPSRRAVREQEVLHEIAENTHHKHLFEDSEAAGSNTWLSPEDLEELRQFHKDPWHLQNPDLSEQGAYAFYDPHDMSVHLPHSTSMFSVGGRHIPPRGIYAHEFAHALDEDHGSRSINPKTNVLRSAAKLSDSLDWNVIFDNEIDGGKLNKYADSAPSEGFAEFARLAWEDPQVARDVFPKAFAFFRQHGLVNDPPEEEDW